jgi:sec-independent protein translocase protein TatC
MDRDDHEFEQPTMTLGEHLEELRWRIIYALTGLAAATIIGLIFSSYIIDFMAAPYRRIMAEAGASGELVVLKISEGFTIYLRIALYSGVLLASPWIFYQLWMFVAAGLFAHERRYVRYAVPFSATLFILGALFFVFVVAEQALRFFIFFNRAMDVESFITLDNHVRFMTSMMLVFGIAFQTPIAILLLAKMGLATGDRLRHIRRHVIVGILIAAMILTPPDVITQIGLAVPMYLLYELGVLLAWLLVFRNQGPDPFEEDELDWDEDLYDDEDDDHDEYEDYDEANDGDDEEDDDEHEGVSGENEGVGDSGQGEHEGVSGENEGVGDSGQGEHDGDSHNNDDDGMRSP